MRSPMSYSSPYWLCTLDFIAWARHRLGDGLLEGQGDAAAIQVVVDHLDGDLLTDADHLLGDVDVALGQLGDVDQALDAVVDPDEGAERHQLGYPAGDQLADLVGAGELPPRVLLGGLERQRDALALQVDVEHLDLD